MPWGGPGLEVPLQDQQRLDRIFALFDSGESPLHQYCRRDPDALVLHGSRPWAWKRRRAPLVRQRRTRPKTTSNILI